MTPTLWERICAAAKARGHEARLTVITEAGPNFGRVSAGLYRNGVPYHQGFGATSNKAIQRLAVGMAQDGDLVLVQPAAVSGWTPEDFVGAFEGYTPAPFGGEPAMPTIGACGKCGDARKSHYTCRDGGTTVPVAVGDVPDIR